MSTATPATGRTTAPTGIRTTAPTEIRTTAPTELDAVSRGSVEMDSDLTEQFETRVFRSDASADRAMRRLLQVDGLDRGASAGAHRAFRTSVLVSAVRCLITYLAIPVLVPLLSLSGWVAAPIGIVLCIIAVVNGVVSVRRFWVADHPRRWMYTSFMGVVFLILAVAMYAELHRMGVI